MKTLIENRIVKLFGPVNDKSAEAVIEQLLILDGESERPIQLYINSPGGSVYQGLGIIDAITTIKAPVHATVIGMAMSMGATILQACATRAATKLSSIMVHQLRGGNEGTYEEMKRDFAESERLHEILKQIFRARTGQPEEVLTNWFTHDSFFGAEQALAYNLIDKVL